MGLLGFPVFQRDGVCLSLPLSSPLCATWKVNTMAGALAAIRSYSLRMVEQKERSLGHYGITQPVLDYLPLGCFSA